MVEGEGGERGESERCVLSLPGGEGKLRGKRTGNVGGERGEEKANTTFLISSFGLGKRIKKSRDFSFSFLAREEEKGGLREKLRGGEERRQ